MENKEIMRIIKLQVNLSSLIFKRKIFNNLNVC